MLSRHFQCIQCGSLEAYRSRSRGFAEKLFLPLVLLRPVRCGGCFRRFYKPLYIQVMKRDEMQMVDEMMALRMGSLQPPMPGLYTEKDSSGASPSSPVRTEEARLQQ